MNTLHLNNLSFERNNIFLFEKIQCRLAAGDVLQIRGANGSGKSTLLRILAGYIQAENNSILWNEKCIAANRSDYQLSLHYLGHQNGMKPALTVFENLKLICALQGKKDFSLIPAVLKKMNLDPDKFAHQLSAGQARKLALTRLLLHPQKLWLLDEPATALDQAAQELVNQLLQEHQRSGGITVIATHQDLCWATGVKSIYLSGPDA